MMCDAARHSKMRKIPTNLDRSKGYLQEYFLDEYCEVPLIVGRDVDRKETIQPLATIIRINTERVGWIHQMTPESFENPTLGRSLHSSTLHQGYRSFYQETKWKEFIIHINIRSWQHLPPPSFLRFRSAKNLGTILRPLTILSSLSQPRPQPP